MDTRHVLLVDAFASEPLGGVPVVVLPDGQADTGLERIASEFGASAVVTGGDDALHCGGAAGADGAVAGAVAGTAALRERGDIDAGTHTVRTDSLETQLEVAVEAGGGVDVELPEHPSESVAVQAAQVAGALGVDPATMEDVGADLPVGKCGVAGGTLLAPVNFLEHLSRAEPDPELLASVLESADAQRVCLFTFDTLSREAAVHARVFDPAARGCERAASGIAAGACGAHLSRNPVFDGDRESVRIECGRFLDRPGTVETTLAARPTVSGAALTVLDGTLSLPPDDTDDEIIEV